MKDHRPIRLKFPLRSIDEAKAFAEEWTAVWNSHDLDRILEHYTEDLEVSSPAIRRLTGQAADILKGKEAVAAYWGAALKKLPDLHFELHDTAAGNHSVAIYYRSAGGTMAIEFLEFADDGRVRRVTACYGDQ